MNRIIFVLLIILCKIGFAQNPTQVLSDIKNYQMFQLKNGFKLQVVQSNEFKYCSYRLSCDVSGVTDMEFVGVKQLTADLTGCDNIDNQLFIKKMISHTGATDSLFEFIASVIYGENFLSFESYKQSKIEYLMDNQNNIKSILNQTIEQSINNNNVITSENLTKITYDAFEECKKQCFSPDKCILTVITSMHPQEVLQLAQKHFGNSTVYVKRSSPEVVKESPNQKIYFVESSQKELQAKILYRAKFPLIKTQNDYLINELYFFSLFENDSEKFSSTKSEKYTFESNLSNDEVEDFLNNYYQTIEKICTNPNFLESQKKEYQNYFLNKLRRIEFVAEIANNLILFRLPKEYYSNIENLLGKISNKNIENFVNQKYLLGYESMLIYGYKPELFCALTNNAKYRELDFVTENLSQIRVFPKGFGSKTIIEDYLKETGLNNLNQDLSQKFVATYIYPDERKYFSIGEILRKTPNMYYFENRILHYKDDAQIINEMQAKPDTVFHYKEVFDGKSGMDSSMYNFKASLDSIELYQLKRKAAYPLEKYYSKLGINAEYICDYQLDTAGIYKIYVHDNKIEDNFDYYSIEEKLKTKSEILTKDHNGDFIVRKTIYFDSYGQKDAYTFPVKIIEDSPEVKINISFNKFDYKTPLKKNIFEVIIRKKK